MASLIKAKGTAQKMPWLQASIVITASPLPHGDRDRMIGSRQRITIRARSLEIGFELLFTKYEHLKLYGFIFLRHGVALGEQTTSLALAEGATLVTLSYDRLGRFRIQQFLRPYISRRYAQALSSLKLAVEGKISQERRPALRSN